MTVCSVANIEQTLFLGCSVIDFSCSLGLNEQPTEMSIRLIKDSCASPAGHSKIYYDLSQPAASIRQEWTGPDPGLNSFGSNNDETPKLGSPVYFRVGDFEFMGLLQSWTKLNAQTDQDIFDVKLTSATEILAGCQVIIGDYAGPIKGFNIFNVYGFEEYFNADTRAVSYTDPNAVVDGPIMGTFAGVFGGSSSNTSGMTWNKIREGISILTSSLSPVNFLGYSDFSEVGRIIYFGGQANANFGLIPRDAVNANIGLVFGLSSDLATYHLDLSEIPNVPDDYRIQGPNIDLLGLISHICNDFGLDFYIDLVPVKDGDILRKYIKVRTIIRTVQPDLNIVTRFISATPEVIDSSFGRELRNENSTMFLVGGAKQNVWRVDSGLPVANEDPEEIWINNNFGSNTYPRARISQFFGINSSGNAYVLNYGGGVVLNDYINLDLPSKHTWKILGAILPKEVPISIGEMRAAEHSYTDWANYSKSTNTYFRQTMVNFGYDIDAALVTLSHMNARFQSRDLSRLNPIELAEQLAAEFRIYRQIIADIYTQSKSSLMVRVPWVASRYQVDSSTVANTLAELPVQSTDVPSEGGWTETNELLYLGNPSTYLDRLRHEDGRVKPFAMFDLPTLGLSGVSLTSAPTNNFDTDVSFAIDRQTVGLDGAGNLLYYTFQQDDQLVYLDRLHLTSPRVVIRFNNALDFQNDSNPFFAKQGWHIVQNQAAFARVQAIDRQSVEGETLIFLAGERVEFPDTVAVTLKSNNFVYGPWRPDNIIQGGPPGQINFQKEEELVPWTYGSNYNLNQVGQARANASVSIMTEGEVGNVTVPGWPRIPIGAELASLSGLTTQFFSQGQHLIENRGSSFGGSTLTDGNGNLTTFIIPSFSFGYWNGSFGPPITNINVEVSSNQNISTTYSFRTYTPKFGVMSKLNSDRLSRRFSKEEKLRPIQRFLKEIKKVQRQYAAGLRRLTQVGDARATKGTPHSVLVGQVTPWDSNIVVGVDSTGDGQYRRTVVATKSLVDIQNNLYNATGYDTQAIMSFDGLIRPVSMSGAGGLPRYVSNISQAKANTPGAIPPFGTGDINSFYNYDISLRYLNPLTNPNGYAYSELQSKHSGSGAHDIDILARGVLSDLAGDGGSLILPVDTGGFYNSGTRGDYASDYRFLALRAPLILQGWGYDTDGKPIPNAADIESAIVSNGQFSTTGLQDKFLPNFLRKPQTWPVAPLDLRYDRTRNVWTAVPPYELVVATLTNAISGNSTGVGKFGLTGYDNIGQLINSGTIILHEKLGSNYSTGAKVFAYYDTRVGQYNILGGGGSGGGTTTTNNIKMVLIDYNLTGVNECANSNTGTLPLWGYQRKTYDLKYYRSTVTGDMCFNTGTGANFMVLATGLVPTGTGTGIGPGYLTTPIYYDDGKDLILGEYSKADYPTYNENSFWPPTGISAGFLTKRLRGIAINDTLVIPLCKELPPQPIPS